MARIRSVHPGIATDEDMLECSIAARLFFILLCTEADDYGCFEWKPVRLKVRLFPADDVDVEKLLAELVAVNRVVRYVADEKQLGAIRNFAKYQRPKKPQSHCPRGNASSTMTGREIDINKYIGLAQKSSEPVGNQFRTGGEPNGDKVGGGSEPVRKSRTIRDHEFGTGTEKSPQKGGREEGRKGRGERESPTTNNQTLHPGAEQADAPEPGGGFFEDQGDGPDPEEFEPDAEPGLGSLGDIPAAKPRERWVVLGEDLLSLTGLDAKPKPVSTSIVRQWLADWSEDEIRAAVSDAVEREAYDANQVGNLRYFEPAIRRRVETRNAEIEAAARKFWGEMARAPGSANQFIGQWRDRVFEWEADKHGPAPDQPGFMGPDELAGPRDQPKADPPRRLHTSVDSFIAAAGGRA